MKIGLCGVPGSGKSDLALALSDELEDVFVADGYAQEYSLRSDLAVGLLGSYVANIGVALERINLERQIKKSDKGCITCGTLLDTSVYAAIAGVNSVNGAPDPANQEDEFRRVNATMQLFGCLYVDSFGYDHVFYLPPRQLPENWSDEMVRRYDQDLQVAFQMFNLTPIVPLMAETVEEQLALAMEAMGEG